jgi:hypothetical protein
MTTMPAVEAEAPTWMLMITMPASFRIGDTAPAKIGKIECRVTWRDWRTMIIDSETRAIVAHMREEDLTCFIILR